MLLNLFYFQEIDTEEEDEPESHTDNGEGVPVTQEANDEEVIQATETTAMTCSTENIQKDNMGGSQKVKEKQPLFDKDWVEPTRKTKYAEQRKREEEELKILKKLASSEEDDKFDRFGAFVAEELRQLNHESAYKYAKRKIQAVLIEAADIAEGNIPLASHNPIPHVHPNYNAPCVGLPSHNYPIQNNWPQQGTSTVYSFTGASTYIVMSSQSDNAQASSTQGEIFTNAMATLLEN